MQTRTRENRQGAAPEVHVTPNAGLDCEAEGDKRNWGAALFTIFVKAVAFLRTRTLATML